MEKSPAVSLVAPVYNTSKYLNEFLSSIENQSDRDFELIIVDDGSTDDSGKIADDFASGKDWVKVIHQTNRGLGLTRNTGLEQARGKYIAFPDSDDLLHPDYVRILKKLALEHQAQAVYGNETSKDGFLNSTVSDETERVIQNGQIKDYVLERIGTKPESEADRYYGAVVNGALFDVEWLKENGLKFKSEREFIAEDIIFDIEALPLADTIVHAGADLYWYRPDNFDSLTRRYRSDRFEKNRIVFHEMERLLQERYTPEDYQEPLDRYIITALRNLIFQEALFSDHNGKKTAAEHISAMINDPEIQQALNRYDIDSMPLKKGLFAKAARANQPRTLLMLSKLWQTLKK